MDVPSQASSLLTKLESYDYTQIDTLFSSFLHPFLNPNKKPPNSKKPSSSSSSIRSLVKTYLPFINKSLSIIPKRLCESPKNLKTADFLNQLLSVYKICLDCLEIASSELSGKPYSVHLQRTRFVHCLLRWERYDEGFDEGIRVLNGLGKVELEGFRFRVSISTGEFVPKVVECVDCDSDGDGEGEDAGDVFVRLVIDLVVVVAQCVSIGKSKDVGKYSGLLVLLREVRPWFRHMEASAASKSQWKLLAHMKNATSFLIREVKRFGENLISRFCEATFQEYTQLLNARRLQVSKLLALMYLVSASRENLSFPRFSGNVHPENYWAAYFHQAAVGTHYNLQLLSAITEKYNSSMFSQVQGSPGGVGMTEKTHALLSIVPESITEIESVMANFFENLPDTAVVCVSFLGKSYVNLLDGLVHYSSSVHGLILLSRLSADSQPVVIVMPVSSRLEDCETSFSDSVNGEIDACKEWRSPWGTNALVDDFAPLFKSILRENYLSSSSSFPEEDTEKTRQMWWSQRYSLDGCLKKLVREMEESWFDQWKYLLLGRLLDAESLIPAMKKLMQEIKERFKLGVNESILEMVMSGGKSTNLEKERIPMVFLEKGCYICSVKDCGEERCSGLDDACAEADYILGSVFAAVNRHEVEYCSRREPVVLVLDSNVQMLPWENMPIMREQEVYRVPSVASIIVALQRRSDLEKDGRLSARFPLIDPLDSFYLLNPSGDLSRTQAEFQDWFRSQNIQGISGVVPSMADCSAALQNHDLFLYFGHGSGAQYMPPEKVKKLETCAATLLMGCSSGTLSFNGCYPPVGTPLAYLLAGAPIVIANLWEVTDRDIDRFAKALLKCFMEERSMSSTNCIQCSLMAEEFESMTVNENLANTKRGRRKTKPTKNTPEVAGGYCFKHKLRAGYFVSQARKACKLPYLIGGSARLLWYSNRY